ncbi:hypothetical protein [Roseomonas sp. WA12]
MTTRRHNPVTGTEAGESAPDILLPLLEPETAARYHDHYRLTELDLSSVNWLLASNDASRLPEASMSRVALVQVAPPPASAFARIVTGIQADVSLRYGVEAADLPQIPPEALDWMRGRFESDRSIRILKAGVTRCIGIVARGRTIQIIQALEAEDRGAGVRRTPGFGD